MISLERVSTATKSELQSFFKSSPQMARELGVLTKEVIHTTAEISKLGYTLKESEYLTRLGLIGKTVGDLDNASDAVDYLTATLKGFRLETEQGSAVLDFMNHTANTTSINFAAIGEGFKRMSASMAEGNNTIEESMGMLVAGYDIVRNSEQVATALRTTSMRLRGVSEEGEDLTYLVPKLEAKFNKFGLSLKKDNETFKSTFEILKDVSTLDITDIERAGILEDIAGKRNAQVIAAIIQNMQTAIDVSESFAESQGSALIEHLKYMEGVEAAHARVASSMSELHMKLLDDDTIVSILNLTSSLIDNITAIGKWNFAILGATGALLFFISATKKMIIANEAMKVMNLGNAFKAILTNLIPATSAMFGMKNAMDATTVSAAMLNAATGGILLALGALTVGIGYLINAQKRQREEMEESINAFHQQKELSDTIDSLIPQYEKLASKTKLTTEEQSKLLDIKQQIVNLLPKSKKALDNENMSLSTQLGIVKDLNKEELERAKNLARKNIAKYEKQYEGAKKEVEESTKALEKWTAIYDELYHKRHNLTFQEQNAFKIAQKEIEKHTKNLEDNKEIVDMVEESVEFYNETLKKQNETLDSLGEKTDEQSKKYKESAFLITQIKEETDKYFDSLDNLAQAYNTLNQGQSLSARQILDLTKKYPELMSQIKIKEGYLYLEKDAIMAVMKAEEVAFKEEVKIWEQTAINVRESLLLKLSAYGEEVKSINDVISARKKLADTYDEVSQFKMVGAVQDVSIKLGKFDIAAKELKDIEARIASLGAIGKADLVGGSIKSSKSSKSASEQYKAIADQYERINLEINKNNNLLQRNKVLQDLAGTDSLKKVNLMKEQIALEKNHQDLLHKKAMIHREEISALETILEKEGFIFKGEGDNRMIENLDKIQGKTKEVEEAFKRYIDLQNREIPALQQLWWDLQKSIEDVGMSMSSLTQQSVRDLLDAERRNREMDLELRQRRAEEQLEKDREEMESEVDYYQSRIDSIQAEIDHIQETEQARQENLERSKRLQEISDLQNKYYILQYQSLEDITEEQAKSLGLEQEREKYLERQVKIKELLIKLDNVQKQKNIQQLQRMGDGTWEFSYVADEREISNLNSQIEKLQLEHSDSITKLKDKTLEDLQKAQENYDEWERQNDIRKSIEERQRRIKRYQDEIRDLQDRYSKLERETNRAFARERENLNRHYTDMDRLANRKMQELIDTFGDNWEAIYNVLSGYFNRISSEYDTLVDSMSKPLPQVDYSSGSYYTSPDDRDRFSDTGNVGGGSSKGGGVSGGKLSDMSRSDYDKYVYYKELWEYANRDGNETAKNEIHRLAQALRDKYNIKEDLFNYNTLKNLSYEEVKRRGYDLGGKIDYTGTAQVHGSKQSPEYVFNYPQFKDLAKMIAEHRFTPKFNIPKIPAIQSAMASGNQIFNIAKLEFPNVKDAQGVIDSIKSLPQLTIQKVKTAH